MSPGEKFRVQVLGFAERTVTADTRREAMEKAAEETDFGDLATDTDEYEVERPDADGKKLYDVYKNGDLVESGKPMADGKANRLDGHTQYNDEENDFEKFRVEEADADA